MALRRLRNRVRKLLKRTILSYFRAGNDTEQPIAADTETKVLYPNTAFDVKGEYNSTTSIFSPNQRGVYSITGSVFFVPNNMNVIHRATMFIHVNNVDIIREDSFFSPIPNISFHSISVNTIVELQETDQVEIFFVATTAGRIFPFGNFAAARFPSQNSIEC
jgi:hypothetical protein